MGMKISFSKIWEKFKKNIQLEEFWKFEERIHSPTLFSTGTESDDTINPDFDTMDIVDISFLDCRDMNVDEYRGDNLSGADSDSNDED